MRPKSLAALQSGFDLCLPWCFVLTGELLDGMEEPMCGLHVPMCGVSTGHGWARPRFPTGDLSMASAEPPHLLSAVQRNAL